MPSQTTSAGTRTCRTLDQVDCKRLPRSAPDNREPRDLSGQELFGHDPDDVVGGSNRNAVDRHDDVAADCDLLAFEVVLLRRRPETRRGGRAPSVDAADDRAARHGVMEAPRDRPGEALGADADKA